MIRTNKFHIMTLFSNFSCTWMLLLISNNDVIFYTWHFTSSLRLQQYLQLLSHNEDSHIKGPKNGWGWNFMKYCILQESMWPTIITSPATGYIIPNFYYCCWSWQTFVNTVIIFNWYIPWFTLCHKYLWFCTCLLQYHSIFIAQLIFVS